MTVHISRREALACAATGMAGLLASAAPVPKAGENKSWVGKTVLPKKPDPLGAFPSDVPDLEGDRSHHIRTFTVRLGGRAVLRMGLAALAVAYLGMAILGPLLLDGAQPVVLAGTHLLVLAVLLRAGLRADPADPEGFTRFYMLVWKAFFLEYVLVPLAYVA